MAERKIGVVIQGVTGRMGDVARRALVEIAWRDYCEYPELAPRNPFAAELERFIRAFVLREPYPDAVPADWRPERLQAFLGPRGVPRRRPLRGAREELSPAAREPFCVARLQGRL